MVKMKVVDFSIIYPTGWEMSKTVTVKTAKIEKRTGRDTEIQDEEPQPLKIYLTASESYLLHIYYTSAREATKLSFLSMANTVKYGIIGVGMMGREHLINLYHLRHEGVRVVCIADPHIPSQQLALNLANSYNWNLQVFSGHKELLDSEVCDAVIVSTPNMTHYEILMNIINHPKPHHVLVEKPLCTTVKDCKKFENTTPKLLDAIRKVRDEDQLDLSFK